jgi:hypothetical protein
VVSSIVFPLFQFEPVELFQLDQAAPATTTTVEVSRNLRSCTPTEATAEVPAKFRSHSSARTATRRCGVLDASTDEFLARSMCSLTRRNGSNTKLTGKLEKPQAVDVTKRQYLPART